MKFWKYKEHEILSVHNGRIPRMRLLQLYTPLLPELCTMILDFICEPSFGNKRRKQKKTIAKQRKETNPKIDSRIEQGCV